MENRYTNRFRALADRSGKQIKAQDAAGNLTERISQARGSLDAQHQNIRELFSTAIEMITGINTHQQMMGIEMVRNVPLPSDIIKASPSKQLGYVQLVMRFLQSGLLHFMEGTYDAQDRITSLEDTIGKLAEYDSELMLLGQLSALDIDSPDLVGHERPVSPPESVKSDSPPKTVTAPIPAPASPVLKQKDNPKKAGSQSPSIAKPIRK